METCPFPVATGNLPRDQTCNFVMSCLYSQFTLAILSELNYLYQDAVLVLQKARISSAFLTSVFKAEREVS
jgi:hypothetical protein